MHTNFLNKSKASFVLAAFLGCTALVVPSVVVSATTVPAKTSWAVSRVASVSQGSYCTMAQKYADAAVLTFARNIKGEYSLALDFQEPRFKSTQKQAITLRPQGGAAQTYNITPQSDKTAVVGIGKDSGFIKQIGATENLAVEIAGDSLIYDLKNFSSGQKELGSCIEALQGSKDKDADMVASTKTGVSSPPAVVNRQVSVVNATASNEPSVEGLLAAKPTPSVGISSLSSADSVSAVPVPVVIAEQPQVKNNNLEREMTVLREENARLMRSMTEQRQAFEEKQSAANGAALDELQQKLDAAKIENDKLRLQQINNSQQTGDVTKLNVELQKAIQSTQSLQLENQSLKAQMSAQTDSQADALKKAGESNATAVKFTQGLDTLKAENTTLRNQIQMYQSKQSDVTVAAEQLAKLQSENAELKKQLPSKDIKAETASAADGKLKNIAGELEQQKQVLATLRSENEALKNQVASLSNVEKKTALVSSSVGDNDKLQKEIRTLRTQIDTTNAEKIAIQNQLSKLQKDSDGAQIKMAGGSWDLEQATRRYQESQREIQRLGAQIQTQQAKCTAEKKEIEYMLFDPAIAKSSQISMLNSLEDQMAEKDAKLKAVEAELMAAKGNSSPDKEMKIADLQKQLDFARSDMKIKIDQATAAQNTVIASLKDELAKKDKVVFETQAQLASVQNQSLSQTQAQQKIKSSLSAQEQNLAALKADLDKKTQQLSEANAKVQQLEQIKSQAQSEDKIVSALKAQLADTQKQLADTRADSQQMDAKVSATQAQTLAALQMQVQQGNQKIVELQNRVSTLGAIPVQPAPVPAAQNISFEPPKQNSVKFLSLDEFSGILKSAGVPVRGALQEVKGGDPASYRAYSWKTDSLYGSVEMRQSPTASGFDTVIGQYLSRAKSRCSGEFAAVPSAVKASNIGQSKSYEIACVNQSASSSASVLFTYGDGIAMTVAHEGRAEAMDIAMDARDRVAGQIR